MTDKVNRPIVSVIVPVYNVEAELDRCVESLVEQSLKEIQVVLVDDGSTDSSGMLCDAWSHRDARIRVIHKPNGGLSSARNAGIEVSEGDYLGFVDSDDYIEPDMYEILLAGIADDNVSIATCGRYVHISGVIKEEYSSAKSIRLTSAEAMRELLLGNIIDVAACDKLYRRELFDQIRYPEGRISEDAAIILQLLDRCVDVVHVGRCLYHYVFRAGSISKSSYNHKKYDVMRNCIEMTDWVTENIPQLSMYMEVYCCVQMAGMIEDMLNTPGARKIWRDDYTAYWNLFRRSYKSYMKFDGHRIKQTVRIVATRIHLYRLFWLVRQVGNVVRHSGQQR